ncbi:hypothetical protein ZOSMA_103G00080 [Zostera marina]|uniref:Uncharacterized protein n=1 Tax=Zostera marina TaxID=29655 RepID=A0A0K9Q4V1_ZOSMR|nr:hypothetical protein ZOSMA_103G00080 [Zostera marina]
MIWLSHNLGPVFLWIFVMMMI